MKAGIVGSNKLMTYQDPCNAHGQTKNKTKDED